MTRLADLLGKPTPPSHALVLQGLRSPGTPSTDCPGRTDWFPYERWEPQWEDIWERMHLLNAESGLHGAIVLLQRP